MRQAIQEQYRQKLNGFKQTIESDSTDVVAELVSSAPPDKRALYQQIFDELQLMEHRDSEETAADAEKLSKYMEMMQAEQPPYMPDTFERCVTLGVGARAGSFGIAGICLFKPRFTNFRCESGLWWSSADAALRGVGQLPPVAT